MISAAQFNIIICGMLLAYALDITMGIIELSNNQHMSKAGLIKDTLVGANYSSVIAVFPAISSLSKIVLEREAVITVAAFKLCFNGKSKVWVIF